MPKITKKGISVHIKHGHPDFGYEFKEIMIGHRSFLALLGFIVGGHMVSRSIWEFTADNYGLLITTGIGVLIFLVAGMVLHEFRDVREAEAKDILNGVDDERRV